MALLLGFALACGGATSAPETAVSAFGQDEPVSSESVKTAHRPTLAVLPLSRGAASEEFAGLGQALAGMIISDLGAIDTFTLVERQRLDALLTEIELAKTGYISAASAQQLGKGLGAELILAGSYSVVEGMFALDMRIVVVESGHIVKAQASQGPIAEWVSVEKDAVERMLGRIDVPLSAGTRRKLFVQTPTEDWWAFTSYSAGVAKEKDGDLTAATTLFEAALASDPEFAAARESLAGLRLMVEQETASDKDRELTKNERGRLKIIEIVPAPASRPADFAYDSKGKARLEVRWIALRDVGRQCQRYGEMWDYLERIDWKLDQVQRAYTQIYPERGPSDPFVYPKDATDLLIEVGLMDADFEPHRLSRNPHRRLLTSGGYATTVRMIGSPNSSDTHLLGAMNGCFGHVERAAEMDKIVARVRKKRELGSYVSKWDKEVNFGTHIELYRLDYHARAFGITGDSQRESRLILNRAKDEKQRKHLLYAINGIVAEGDMWERQRFQLAGLPLKGVVGATKAIAASDLTLFDSNNALCTQLVKNGGEAATQRLESYASDQEREGFDAFPWGMGQHIARLRDLGCLKGVPSRFGTLDEAISNVASSPSRRVTRPDEDDEAECESKFSALETQLTKGATDASGTLYWYYNGLVRKRCVSQW